MSQQPALTIYNASAGSGKTFTLVKAYLKLILQSNNPHTFKNILALTFTNKAVGEMKKRIIDTLKSFSNPNILTQTHPMFNAIVEDLEINPHLLHSKSIHLLELIVHNYAAFDVSTIDKFNHSIIRTFAYDLKLPLNFEVEMDTSYLLAKAVDKLIDKAGTDNTLTNVLVNFAIEKVDDDKSWDISRDFNTIAQLLIKENDLPFIELLKNKTLIDFNALKTLLEKQTKEIEKVIVEKASQALQLILENGLEFSDFSGSYLPKYFQKLASKDFKVTFNRSWQNKLVQGEALHKSKSNPSTILALEKISYELASLFKITKKNILEFLFLKNVLKNLTPLSVLNEIQHTLNTIKQEDEILLISEFNSIINKEIKAQPTPFIYERIGEKYNHFFIDEFQDTSVLQWENLMPLVDNALSSQNLKGESGSAMLVGDAKQAIYRWRGGKAEQFIDLCIHPDPFYPFFVERSVKNLEFNYRSSNNIVNFNNNFFRHIAPLVFANAKHEAIYEKSSQIPFIKEDGFVEISFHETNNSKEDKNTLYGNKVLDIIDNVLQKGGNLNDICIVTRKKREGVLIAEFLSGHDIDVISSESLLLTNAPEVNFITTIIAYINQPNHTELKIELLSYLNHNHLFLEDAHSFFSELAPLKIGSFFKTLQRFGFYFDYHSFLQLPLYDAIEAIIRAFNLSPAPNAYVQSFLDVVLDYTKKEPLSFSKFMEYWELKKDRLSIAVSQESNAVQIMTIHKAKGLEFPVVIFPYANLNTYNDKLPKTWFQVEEKNYNDFSYLYVNNNKELGGYNDLGEALYQNHRSNLELDAVNLLYVALTRAENQLYIISEYDVDSSGKEKTNNSSGLFISYLKSIHLWEDSQKTYSFGKIKNLSSKKHTTTSTLNQTRFISVAKEEHQLYILANSAYHWDTNYGQAIEKGNLIHLIMSYITTSSDIDDVLKEFCVLGKINSQQKEYLLPLLHQITFHPKLKEYFSLNHITYMERDIITKEGKVLRPDRLILLPNNKVVIIDYKTGKKDEKHQSQLLEYQEALEEMNYSVIKKILVYIDEVIDLVEVSF